MYKTGTDSKKIMTSGKYVCYTLHNGCRVFPQFCLIVEKVLSVTWTFDTVHGDEWIMSLCQVATLVAKYFILCQ
jgi:hypothetical protein